MHTIEDIIHYERKMVDQNNINQINDLADQGPCTRNSMRAMLPTQAS